MSESPDTLTDGVRWGSRLAVVGIIIAALSLAVSVLGIGSINPLYWAGILLSIIAVTGAAIRGAQYSVVRYAGGVISAMIGVFVIGYGVENGTLLIMLVGVVILVVGALGVIFDTQRTE
jgi:hypothetical protein